MPVGLKPLAGPIFRHTAALVVMLAGLGMGTSGPALADGMRAPVFFRNWSANLDPAALGVIGHVAKTLQASPGITVQVIGTSDRDGSAEANRLLSATRAQVVTDRLVLDGVEPNRIHQASPGATGVAQHAQESRRVILVVAPN